MLLDSRSSWCRFGADSIAPGYISISGVSSALPRRSRPWLLLLQRPSPSLLSSGPSRNALDLSPEAPDFTEVLAPGPRSDQSFASSSSRSGSSFATNQPPLRNPRLPPPSSFLLGWPQDPRPRRPRPSRVSLGILSRPSRVGLGIPPRPRHSTREEEEAQGKYILSTHYQLSFLFPPPFLFLSNSCFKRQAASLIPSFSHPLKSIMTRESGRGGEEQATPCSRSRVQAPCSKASGISSSSDSQRPTTRCPISTTLAFG